jgi:hypothetical protein
LEQLAKIDSTVLAKYGSLRAGIKKLVFCIAHEADGLAEVDDEGEAEGLGLALGVDDGLELGLGELLGVDEGDPLGDELGERLGLDDGERLELGLELISGSSALGRIASVTSSIWVTNLPDDVSRITAS